MPRRRLFITALLAAHLLPATGSTYASEIPTSDELLQRSIAHHDPEGRFLTEEWCLTFRDTRPNADDRRTDIMIDVPGERFKMVRGGEHEIAGNLDEERCEMTLNGRSDFTEAEQKEHRLSCERLHVMRNYYTYLWGLPMKLRDPGTHLSDVKLATFQSEPAYSVQVTYDPGIGDDTWYFYFDPTNAALIGYRFYHDESKNDGEYIVLTEEYEGHGIRLPKSRAWNTHQDERHLGTDILESIERCGADATQP